MTFAEKIRCVVLARGGRVGVCQRWAVSPQNEIIEWDETSLGPRPAPEEIEAATMSPEAAVAAGAAHVLRAGFDADRKVILLNKLLKAKDAGALASVPKLVALYGWMETVQGMAVAGQTMFPACPHTFEEVIAE